MSLLLKTPRGNACFTSNDNVHQRQGAPSITCPHVESAAIRRRSVHEIMIQALERYVSREEKQEAIRQECIKAHDEYKLTGLHVADEEIDDGV